MQVARRDIIVIGGSAGSVSVLRELLPLIPNDLGAAILIAIHRRLVQGHDLLSNIVNNCSRMVTVRSVDGKAIEPGHMYVAPPTGHMLINHGVLHLENADSANVRKSIDVLFTSAAKAYGERVIGIMLSGTMQDGTKGFREIRKHGGVTVVQDPQEAAYSSMVQSAMRDVPVDFCLTVKEIAVKLKELVAGTSGAPKAVKARVMVVEDEWMLASELERELSELGYDVVATVASGEDALAAASAKPPDIAIMDVGLSGKMNGTETASQLWEKLHVPIIFLTGRGDQATLAAAQPSMPYAFLSKPHQVGQLHSTIQLALFRRAQELR